MKSKVVKDGWHTIRGCEVYVEDGYIIRGIKEDSNGGRVTAYVCKPHSGGGWIKVDRIKVDTFRKGKHKLA